MSQATPVVKYLKDYQAPTHLVEDLHLTFDLQETFTRVTASFIIRVNPKNPSKTLNLDGDGAKLLSVSINRRVLTSAEYQLDAESLRFFCDLDRATIEVITEIEPHLNTKLMGLYLSNGNYCTQCESHGFRRMTYYFDRPDVMTTFTTTIIADQKKYPVLLSNGNLKTKGVVSEGRHFAVWHDPFAKPCYLFALVAGDLGHLQDTFTTASGKLVNLFIYAAHDKIQYCDFAMQALKKSMAWDEEVYGREYDLDVFHIVAVNDFNFGAMENKSLNIFNDRYILVSGETATDDDYAAVDTVVSHEYFHNWSGNRVTLRDWFQLSLKEGFTVMRDHGFSEDVGLQEVVRIKEVQKLRMMQFPEDAGPLAHPVRPESYIEMNNFYTATVYEKGSEVIRMMRTILGDANYRRGTDLYFERYDGQAVTCDDFIATMAEAGQRDFTQFKLWYSQAGTPALKFTGRYEPAAKTFTLTASQTCPPTPGQPRKQPMCIPIKLALLDHSGKTLATEKVILLTETQQSFVFENIHSEPIPSLMRGFSAPVHYEYPYSDAELAVLIAKDTDGFARWEASQLYANRLVLEAMQAYQEKQNFVLPATFVEAFRNLLKDQTSNKALIAEMLVLPDEQRVMDMVDAIDIAAIRFAVLELPLLLARALQAEFAALYQSLSAPKNYQYQVEEVAERSLKNTCIAYLNLLSSDFAVEQFKTANNMTDQISALAALAHTDTPARLEALAKFYQSFQAEPLVLDKWFAVQAAARRTTVFQEVQQLLKHPDFSLKNPNKVRAVVATFMRRNMSALHRVDGAAYTWLTDLILELDGINPMVAARLMDPFTRWKKFDQVRQGLMKASLERILAKSNLSKDLFEVTSKILA